jgi:DNA-binding NarL/FixJ family response regulator
MDWIGLLEASYRVEGSLDGWLGGVLESAQLALDVGFGAYGQVIRLDAGSPAVESVVAIGGMAGMEADSRTSTEGAPAAAFNALFRSGLAVGSASAIVEQAGHLEEFTAQIASASGGRIADFLGVVAPDSEGRVVTLAGAQPRRASVANHAARRWTRVAAHLGAGSRLHARMAAVAGASAEAVMQPDGKVLHASGDAISARDVLRHAAVGVDRARTRLRRENPDEALDLWSGLVAGRWSLVDRFEEGGRRFVVAYRNEARVPDPRGLSRREHIVCELLGRGRASKEVAYELGISVSAVFNAASRARAKLGLSSTTELVAFFSPGGVRAQLCAFELGGARLAVGRFPDLDDALASLSEGERDVILRLVAGFTNRAIAHARGTSERTVANQVASAFAKLGVSSRLELAARCGQLAAPDSASGPAT